MRSSIKIVVVTVLIDLITVEGAALPRNLPTGTYVHECPLWVMQVNVVSPSLCDLEFGAKQHGAIFSIPDVPYIIDDQNRAVVYPNGKPVNPALDAMALMLNIKLVFPAHGIWHPEENRLSLHLNIDWDLRKEKRYNLLEYIEPDHKTRQFLYFGALSVNDLQATSAAPTTAPEEAIQARAAKGSVDTFLAPPPFFLIISLICLIGS